MTWAGDRSVTAVHEAGHALVATVCGLGVRLVTVLSDDPCQRSQAFTALSDDPEHDLEAAVMVRLAGRQALVGMGDLDAPGAELGCRRDLEEARAFALVLGGDEVAAQGLLKELRERVDNIMLDHHLELGRLSLALIERWSLTGAEVAAVVAGIEHPRGGAMAGPDGPSPSGPAELSLVKGSK